jgi:hypothetical protein
MLHNLLAMLALLESNEAGARAELDLTDAVPDAAPAAHGVIELNRSFLGVAARQAADAERHYAAGKAMTAGVHLQGWDARVSTLGALVAWSRGDLARAETRLREAIAEAPQDETPHEYLAQLLDAQGRTADAAAERTTAGKLGRFEIAIPAQVQSLYWVDPVKGGMRRRN